MKDSQGKTMVKIPKAMKDSMLHPITHPECYDEPMPKELKDWILASVKKGYTYKSSIENWKANS